MKTLPPFRTFVNAFGTCPKNLLWPIQRIQPLWVPCQQIHTWYWLLSGLTIDYAYVINDFPIHRSIYIDGTRFGLKERIQGGWTFANPGAAGQFDGVTTDNELDLTTTFKLYLCQIYDTNNTMDPKARSDQYNALLQAQPILCTDAPLPPQQPLGLLLYFKELANNGDFVLSSMPEEAAKTTLHTLPVPFLSSQLNFSLSTDHPEDIEGKITSVSLTPEFFEVKGD